MKFDNLAELAKAVSLDIIYGEFKNTKKFPLDKDLVLNIDMLPDDEYGDMAREDPDEFMRLVNIAVVQRLNHMYEEGFLAKKNGYYRCYTKKELREQLDDISINGVD